MKPGSWQQRMLEKNLRALRIAAALTAEKGRFFSTAELREAQSALTDMAARTKSAKTKFEEGTSQHTLQRNRLFALQSAIQNITEKLEKTMIQNETLEIILARRSVRAYRDNPVPGEALSAILKAGQAAPYVSPDSRHFSVIQTREILTRLCEDAKAEGMKISDFHRELFSAPGFDGSYGAPAAVILSGSESTVQYEAVCGASAQNMLVAAQSLGIASCWVYFPVFAFHGAKAAAWRKELRIRDGYIPVAAVLLGYAADGSPSSGEERYQNEISYIGG